MIKFFLLIFLWGPSLLGYGTGWMVANEPGLASISALVAGVVLTAVSYGWGMTNRKGLEPDYRAQFDGAMLASPWVGVVLFYLSTKGLLG